MSKKIIIANWKMNPRTSSEALNLLLGINKLKVNKKADLVLCPPSVFIGILKNKSISKFKFGAQDCSIKQEGPFTGEVGASMLKSLGVNFIILGHSERRALGEDSDVIKEKIKEVFRQKMIPIVCIGEKQRGTDGEHFAFLKKEIVSVLEGVSKENIKKIIFAYEPVWAISTFGKGSMENKDISETITFLKRVIAEYFGPKVASGVKFVYGGSINSKNIKDLSKLQEVSGFLVGKASLNLKDFGKIVDTLCK